MVIATKYRKFVDPNLVNVTAAILIKLIFCLLDNIPKTYDENTHLCNPDGRHCLKTGFVNMLFSEAYGLSN